MLQEANSGGGTGERVGVVLVEEDPDEETGSRKDSVTVTKATKLFEPQGQDLTQVGFDNLKVRQRARAWYAGPVAESYPRQARARVIVATHPPNDVFFTSVLSASAITDGIETTEGNLS